MALENGTGCEGTLTACNRSVHKALKQARQFEVRKLSAQLWKLKEGDGSGGRKKRKLASGPDEERLQAEIEALKALDLEPVTQLAIAQARDPSAASEATSDPGGLEVRLLADMAVVTALRNVRRQLAPPGAVSSGSELSVSASEDESRDGPGDSEGGGTSSDEDPQETNRKRMRLLAFLPPASRITAQVGDADSAPGHEGGGNEPRAKKRKAEGVEGSGLGAGKGPERGRGKKEEKKPEKKRLGQHARQRLREQYASGTLPPWMVKTYARYLKPAAAAGAGQADLLGSGTRPASREGFSTEVPQRSARGRGSGPFGEGGASLERGRGRGSGFGGRGAGFKPAGEINLISHPARKPAGGAEGTNGRYPRGVAGKGKGGAELHPSWEAKRIQAVKLASVVPNQGKKTVFDEEERPGVVPPTTGTGGEGGDRKTRLNARGTVGASRGFGSKSKGSAGKVGTALHPSWEAKRVLAEKAVALISNQGKKIVFDD